MHNCILEEFTINFELEPTFEIVHLDYSDSKLDNLVISNQVVADQVKEDHYNMHFATWELAFILVEHIKEPLKGYKVPVRCKHFIQVILVVDQRQQRFEHQFKDSQFDFKQQDKMADQIRLITFLKPNFLNLFFS